MQGEVGLGPSVTGEAPLQVQPPPAPSKHVDNGSHCAHVHQEIMAHDVSYVSPAERRQGPLLDFRGHGKEGHLQCRAHIIKTTFRDFILI